MRRIIRDDEDYKSIVGFLTTYQRQGDNRTWDHFRNKMPPEILKIWGDLLIECRRNGFVAPRAEGGKIVWKQLIGTNDIRNGDLCTMCDRDCAIRERMDSGEAKRIRLMNHRVEEGKKCWQDAG